MHEKRAEMVLNLEKRVSAIVAELKERRLVSPYLCSFVLARLNPLNENRGELRPSLEHVLSEMQERALKFNVKGVTARHLAISQRSP